MRDARQRLDEAVRAAQAVAARHGVRADAPRVLHDGVNVVVHLAPAPVVARVATLTPLLRPDPRSFVREVALAAALADAGAAVIPPADVLPPGPHGVDGLTVSFWRHVEVLPELPSPEVAGRTLAELHDALAELDPGWDGAALDTPLDDLATFVDRGTELGADAAPTEQVAALTEALRPLLDLTGRQVLHGDTHPGNLLATPDGWRWADLEDTCRGPWAWDVAMLRSSRRLDGRAAVDAMPEPLPDEELAPYVWLRRLHTVAWWFVHAVRVPEDLPAAREQLRAAVTEVGAALAQRHPGRR